MIDMYQSATLLCLINIICSKYMNVIRVQKHTFAHIEFLTKNCNIPMVSVQWYHGKVYNERKCTTCYVCGDE